MTIVWYLFLVVYYIRLQYCDSLQCSCKILHDPPPLCKDFCRSAFQLAPIRPINQDLTVPFLGETPTSLYSWHRRYSGLFRLSGQSGFRLFPLPCLPKAYPLAYPEVYLPFDVLTCLFGAMLAFNWSDKKSLGLGLNSISESSDPWSSIPH